MKLPQSQETPTLSTAGTSEEQAAQAKRGRALWEMAEKIISGARWLPFPSLISFRQGGTARSEIGSELAHFSMNKEWRRADGETQTGLGTVDLEPSETVNNIFDKTPIPEITPKSFRDILGNLNAEDCQFYGRTVVFKKNGKEYALKFQKRSESGFSDEWRSMHRMQELKKPLGLKGRFADVSDPVATGVYRLTDARSPGEFVPKDFERRLAEQAAKGAFELADFKDMELLLYEHPEKHHVYFHDPTIPVTRPAGDEVPPEEAAKQPMTLPEASEAIMHDMAMLARHNVYRESGVFAHNLERDLERDLGYQINIDEIRSPANVEEGPGRVHGYRPATEHTNNRQTGPADPKGLRKGTELKLLEPDHYSKELRRMLSEAEYKNLPGYKNLSAAVTQRSVILNNILDWAICLMRSWQDRLTKIEAEEKGIEPIDLTKTLRDGLVTFFSTYTGCAKEDVETAFPLSPDDPQKFLMDFDRIYTQIRFFISDAYAERAEEQPHAVMRKGLARCLARSASLPEKSQHEIYKKFTDKADDTVRKNIEPLFGMEFGLAELGKVLHAYPKARENICRALHKVLNVQKSYGGADQWLPLFSPARIDYLSKVLQQQGYHSFDDFLKAMRAHENLDSSSPLHTAQIPAFPDKETLAKKFAIFCRTFTGMTGGEIAGFIVNFSNDYDKAKDQDKEALQHQFGQQIAAVQTRVYQAATAEAVLSELEIDFDKVKRDKVKQAEENAKQGDAKTPEAREAVTKDNVAGILEKHIGAFLEKYSEKRLDKEEFAGIAAAFAKQIPTDALIGRNAGYNDVLRHVFNIDFDDITGASEYARVMFSDDPNFKVVEPWIVDIIDENPARHSSSLPRGHVRGEGSMHDGKNQDLGGTNSINPLVEFMFGLMKYVTVAQVAGSFGEKPR